MNLVKLFIFLFITPSICFGKYDSSLSYSLGLLNVNITENTAPTDQTDTNVNKSSTGEATTASVSGISGSLTYEAAINNEFTWTRKLTFPLVSNDLSSVYTGSIGVNWYLNGIGSRYVIRVGGSEVKLSPKLRYYIGGSVGIGNLIYNTDSATKTDVFVDLGGHGGGHYLFNEDWSLSGEVGAGKGTGALQSNINIKILFGASMYL